MLFTQSDTLPRTDRKKIMICTSKKSKTSAKMALVGMLFEPRGGIKATCVVPTYVLNHTLRFISVLFRSKNASLAQTANRLLMRILSSAAQLAKTSCKALRVDLRTVQATAQYLSRARSR